MKHSQFNIVNDIISNINEVENTKGRVKMVKCIKGVNDLESQRPELMKQWDYQKNNIDPTTLLVGSGKKVWWNCEKGHSWQAEIYRRSAGAGCPFCAGQRVITGENDLQTQYPLLAMEWNYEKNNGLSPHDIMGQSGKKVWWKCAFGHEWLVSPNSRVSQNAGCPICGSERKTSFPEQAILYYVGKYLEVKSRLIIDGMEFDIFLPQYKIAIEYDGIFYHDRDSVIKKEEEKEKYCLDNNICLVRVKEIKTGKEKSILRKSCARKIFYRNLKDGEKSLENVIRELFEWLYKENVIKGKLSVDILRDKEEIWSQYIMSQKEKSLQECYPQVALQWNYERNGALQPNQVMPNSHKKVWWKCEKGHEWEATLSHRVEGTGCPYCSHQKFLKGFNDLATLFPHLTKEWNYKRNALNPEDVLGGGQKKYWWICEYGHEWESSIRKRIDGRKCPVCSGKKVVKGTNDFATVCSSLVSEWNYEKNNILPENATKYSNKRVWWICGNGHEWLMSINARSMGKGCPECSKRKRVETRISNTIKKNGSLRDVYPGVAKEWDYNQNGELIPEMCTPHSNKKVWWICENGHQWQAVINNRVKGQGCPICARNKRI